MIFTAMLSLAALGQVLLTGSDVGLGAAQAKASLIVVAKPQLEGILGTGTLNTGLMDLSHLTVLKGSPSNEVMRRVCFSYHTSYKKFEFPPQSDEEYVFFLYNYKGSLNVCKILIGSEENIAAVKKEMKENP